MKVDYYTSGPPEGALRALDHALELGYDGFFSTETRHDPFLSLAVAGATGPDMDMGTAIAVSFPRSPMVTAMASWDLARMTNGRFLLGLGTQIRPHITRRFSTEWGQPTARLKDYILSMKAIWDNWQNGTPLRYHGEFYKFTLMTPFFNPGPIQHSDIPIYIAGVGPRLSRLAGEVCNGLHVHPFHTVGYLDEVVLPAIGSGAEAAGRSADDVDVASTVFVMTGKDDSEVEQAIGPIKRQISFYASTPSYRPVLEASGFDIGEDLNAMSKRGEWDEMAGVVPDDLVLQAGIAAPIDKLGSAIRDRYGDRIDRIGFYTVGSSLDADPDAVRQVISDLKPG